MRRQVRVVDSHTGGEPTRVVIEGGPDLGGGPLSERRARFTQEHDRFRTAIVAEPRGHEAVVGALLVAPHAPGCAAGVVFFDGAGTLGMCGHGTIGLVATLAHLGPIAPGRHRVDTPVGAVEATLHHDGRVTIANVASFRHARDVRVDVPGFGAVVGDVAWGGNWFYLVRDHGLPIGLEHRIELTRFTSAVREALRAAAVTGADGADVDHVELFGPSQVADSRNFVLCPGGAYDRSPCGTGTSAKLACLAADGRLAPGAVWRQESVTGSVFEGTYAPAGDGRIRPSITGRAYVTAESTLCLDDDDPLCWGLR
ncbi:MAG: 4-hydroxyproline epimerase [Vicinamibacteria bacterium]